MEFDDIKSVPFKVKAAGPDDGLSEGQFEGYASVFGNRDSYGDVVVKGAFAASLAEWREKGDPIPLLWGHDFHDPFSNIGAIDSAEEDDHGLKVRGTFDMENPKAVQVYRLAKGRRCTGMSFAYDVLDEDRQKDANYLKALHIYEASIVPIGANALAGVGPVKAAADALATKGDTDTLRKMRDAIDSAISSIGDGGQGAPAPDNDQEQASGDPEAKSGDGDEEPEGAKSPAPDEEPKADPSVDAVLAVISIAERN